MDVPTAPSSYPLTANAVLLPFFALLTVLLNVVPLLILIRARNLPVITLILSNGSVNLCTFLNGVIWSTDNQATWWNGRGLCDIEVAFKTPLYTLLASSTCCLVKDLARAVDVDNPRLFESRAQRRRRVIIDCLFIFGIPVAQCVLHYFVQTNRYALIATYGCIDLVDDSWPKIALLSIWPLLFGSLNCYYAVITIHRLRKHRGKLSKTLSHTGSGLDSRKFLKLFFMAIIIVIIYLPVVAYFFSLNIPSEWIPYSWSRIHDPDTWNYIFHFKTSDYPDIQFWPWPGVVTSVMLFLFYGITFEAIVAYRRLLVSCGFAKWWPVLKEPYQPRSRHGSAFSNTKESRTSWTSKLDVIGKAANYLDGTKGTQKETSEHGQASNCESYSLNSRKGSLAKQITSTTDSDPDRITSIPSPCYSVELPPRIYELQEASNLAPSATLPHHRHVFSSFRTHINFPFPLFTSASNPVDSKMSNKSDPEKQSDTIQYEHGFSSNNTVETNIWSGSIHEDVVHDPASPKMGTKAYREHERREMAKRESRENDDVTTRIIADNVRVDLGLPAESGETERDVVVVRHDMVRREEIAEEPSSSL